MGKGGMGGGGMGSGGKALDAPCSQIMVRTALDGPREWTILEMQGEFEAREGGHAKLNNLEIGNLTCKDGSNSVVLVIGNQRLDGKINQLKEPLAVMSKLKKAPAADSCVDGGDTEMKPASDEAAMERDRTTGTNEVEFQIVGVVRRKIVFNARPTIVTQHSSPSKDLGSQRFV